MTEKAIENTACQDENHEQHLCSLLCRNVDMLDKDAYGMLTREARFRCQVCDRTAHNAENLCDPMKL